MVNESHSVRHSELGRNGVSIGTAPYAEFRSKTSNEIQSKGKYYKKLKNIEAAMAKLRDCGKSHGSVRRISSIALFLHCMGASSAACLQWPFIRVRRGQEKAVQDYGKAGRVRDWRG